MRSMPTTTREEQEQLFETHRGTALAIARVFAKRHRLRVDQRIEMEAAALVGLWQAAAHFDPARNLSFNTYLDARVRVEMVVRYWADRPVGRPSRLLDRLAFTSLDAPVRAPSGKLTTHAALLADPRTEPPARDDTPDLDRLIANLNHREREALRLQHAEGLLLREIGQRLGVSESRVSQIVGGVLDHLRRDPWTRLIAGRAVA